MHLKRIYDIKERIDKISFYFHRIPTLIRLLSEVTELITDAKLHEF